MKISPKRNIGVRATPELKVGKELKAGSSPEEKKWENIPLYEDKIALNGFVSKTSSTPKVGTKDSSDHLPPLFEKLRKVKREAKVVPVYRTRPEERYSIPLVDMGFVKAHEMGITGKGVTVVVMDSGVRADHPDLKGKVIRWIDMSGQSDKPFDDIGHGTHVSGIIAGSGKMSDGFYMGGAPDVNLIVIRVTNPSEVLKAIDWVKANKDKYNIKVVNMSLGVDPSTSWKADPLARAAQGLVEDGVTVVAAAGNDYTAETIDSPGVAPGVITVGGADDKGTYTESDDTMYVASSRGPTPYDKLPKPDVVAYSTKVVSLRSPGSFLDPYSKSLHQHSSGDNSDHPEDSWSKGYYIQLSGTSQGTAWVSALAALLYQVNPDLSPQQVKEIIKETARPLRDPETGKPYSEYDQGAGLIDAYKAVLKALKMRGVEDGELKLSPTSSELAPLLKGYPIDKRYAISLSIGSSEVKLGYLLSFKESENRLREIALPLSFATEESGDRRLTLIISPGIFQPKQRTYDEILASELLDDNAVAISQGVPDLKAIKTGLQELKVSKLKIAVPLDVLTKPGVSSEVEKLLRDLKAEVKGTFELEVLITADKVANLPSLNKTIRDLREALKLRSPDVRLKVKLIPGKALKNGILEYVASRIRSSVPGVRVEI